MWSKLSYQTAALARDFTSTWTSTGEEYKSNLCTTPAVIKSSQVDTLPKEKKGHDRRKIFFSIVFVGFRSQKLDT